MSDAFDFDEAPPSSPPYFLLPSRKRVRTEDVNTSSDPPLFSSDPADPSIDGKSYKRRYRGAWWGVDVLELVKSPFVRNLDSGVWMGSDGSDDAAVDSDLNQKDTEPDAEPDAEPAEGPAAEPAEEPVAELAVSLAACRSAAFSRALEANRSAAEKDAYRIVYTSAELDCESVDISGLHLGHIPDDLLFPLRFVTKQAGFLRRDDSPKDEDFEPLRPELKLFMQQNALRKLPAELWNLENLTVLSLRQNKLAYIPAAIGRLRNLRELNLACNRLRYLPWELLSLISGNNEIRSGPIRNFTVSPNPFFRAVGVKTRSEFTSILNQRKLDLNYFEEQMASAESQEAYRDAAWSKKLYQYYYDIRKTAPQPFSWDGVHALHMSSTPVVYLDVDGSPMDTQFPLPSTFSGSFLFTNSLDGSKEYRGGTFVPSLFELSTSLAKKVPGLHTLLPDNTPAPIFRALDLAKAVKEEEGDRICSVCKRSYVIPRTEWVEFWHRIPVNPRHPELLTDMDELFLPFLRRGCSWRCVPS